MGTFLIVGIGAALAYWSFTQATGLNPLGIGSLSGADIAEYAAAAGFAGDDLLIAVQIAQAESSGNPGAVGDQGLAPERGPSIGLWQINIGSLAHPEYANVDLTDPQTNANAAFAVYSAAGGDFSPWTTYTSGAYLNQAGF